MIPASKLNGPALAPPPGVIPNFDNPPNQDILIRVLFSIFLGLVTLAVVGRIYIRVFYLKQGFLGDVFLLAAYVLFVAEYAIAYRASVVPGAFVHQWNVRLRDLGAYLHLTFASSVIYIFTILSIKIAILLEWLRLFCPAGNHNWAFWATHFLLWTNIIFYVSEIVALNIACTPYQYTWNRLIPGNCHRVNTKNTDLAASVFNFISDVLILLIPQRTIWSLRMGLKRRLSVSIVFAVGIFGCGCGLARLVETVRHAASNDLTYTFSPVQLWSGAELTCGFLVICVPSLPKAFQAMEFAKVKSTLSFWSRKSSQRHLRSSSKGESGEAMSPPPNSIQRSNSGQIKPQDNMVNVYPLSDLPKLNHSDSAKQLLNTYEDMGHAEQGIVRTRHFEINESSS